MEIPSTGLYCHICETIIAPCVHYERITCNCSEESRSRAWVIGEPSGINIGGGGRGVYTLVALTDNDAERLMNDPNFRMPSSALEQTDDDDEY